MGYEDFVWFIMSEEDKSSEMALDYWFRCCDLDGDGCLRANEMLVSIVCCCCLVFSAFAFVLFRAMHIEDAVVGVAEQSVTSSDAV